MKWRKASITMLAGFCVLASSAAQADVFNMGPGLTNLEFVPVGNAGNDNDDTGYGSVAEPYLIGKYEVTNAQWREFLTAKASVGDPYGLYNTEMAEWGGITRSGLGTVEDPYIYSPKGGDANWDNRPVNYVSLWDAARFCNWLHNARGTGDTESGAYVNIGNEITFARQPGALYFIPTNNEWYKAAYHKNDGVTTNYFDYPTSSDSTPSNDLIDPDPGNSANFDSNWPNQPADFTIGPPYYASVAGEFENSASPYGTFDQGGNLSELNESVAYGSYRVLRGGSWYERLLELAGSEADLQFAWQEENIVGFRVASVPEPGSIVLLVCGAVAGLIWCGRRMYSSRSA